MNREHGLPSTYRHGCRCEPCRMANTIYSRKQPPLANRERVELWKRVHRAGIAAEVCDHIYRERPVPLGLLHDLGMIR